MSPSEATLSRSGHLIPWAIALPGLVFVVLGAVVTGSEALKLGPLADAATIESYHFGSEAMVGHGGWPYESRTAYVVSSAVEFFGLSGCAGLLAFGALRRRPTLIALGYAGIALFLFS